MVQCMPDMPEGQWVDWVLAKADAAGIEWLHTKATDSGAEHISDLAFALDFWLDRVPRREMENFQPAATAGQLHAVREVICYFCGGSGHYHPLYRYHFFSHFVSLFSQFDEIGLRNAFY